MDVVADEINKLYSKRIFNTDDNYNSLIDENLKQIEEEIFIDGKEDFGKLIPCGLPTPFTSRDFAKAIKRTRAEAQTALNVLRAVGAVTVTSKDKNTYLYEVT